MLKSTITKLVRILSALVANDSTSSHHSLLRERMLLRIESLEKRELLSADGLLSSCVATYDRTDESAALFSEASVSEPTVPAISIEDASGTRSSYSIAPPPEQVLRDESSYIEALSGSEVFWEDENLEFIDESTIETGFVDTDVEHFDESQLLASQVVFADNAFSSVLDNGSNLLNSGGGSGDGGDLETYDLTITTTLMGGSLSASSGGAVNPVLEQRGITASGALHPSADYVIATFPAMPPEYKATVTLSGVLGNCAVYTASEFAALSSGGSGGTVNSGGFSGSGGSAYGGFDSFEYSGGGRTLYFVPINDSMLESICTITATIETTCLSGGATGSGGNVSGGSGNLLPGNFQQYEFTNTGAQTIMTIIDDDQWQFTVVVDADGAVAWEAGADNSRARRNGSFHVIKSPNASVAGLTEQYPGYSLDNTFSTLLELSGEGTASLGSDYTYLSSGYSEGYLIIPNTETSVIVYVVPKTEPGEEGSLFENDETVIPTLYSYEGYTIGSTQGQIDILQAPEFISGEDANIFQSGGGNIVNVDHTDLGFKYEKPSVGTVVDVNLIGTYRSIRQGCTLQTNDQYFEIVNNQQLRWKSLPTDDTYEFSIIVKVVDPVYDGLYDEITISIKYGWASFTACVIPAGVHYSGGSGGSGGYSGGSGGFDFSPFGHACWIVEATPSLVSYCYDNYNAPGSIYSNYRFTELTYGFNRVYGLHPRSLFDPGLPTGDFVSGEIRDDYDYIAHVNTYASFIIPSREDFFDALVKIYADRHNGNLLYKLWGTESNPSRNCVDMVIEVAYTAGITLNVPRGQYPGGVASLPSKLAETLRNSYSGVSGGYSIGSSNQWSHWNRD